MAAQFRRRFQLPLAALCVLLWTSACGTPPAFEYPETRATDHVDTYHGTAVPDPYRWLEDDNSAETAAWVEAQNAVTFAHLEQIPFREALKARLERLYDYERYSAPSRKGEHFFFSKNDGLQNQSVLYIQRGLDGEPEVLIDPNTWSEDGTVRLTSFELSKDGRHAVYGVSRSGSDWQEYKVLEIATKTTRCRHGGVDQGVEPRVARRRLLLQPVPGARAGARTVVREREPPGLLPPAGHLAGRRHADLRRRRAPAAVPRRAYDRGRALRGADHLRPGDGQEGQLGAPSPPRARRPRLLAAHR
jgi:hypothetical protein